MFSILNFIVELKARNQTLFLFGCFNFFIAFALAIASFFVQIEYMGTHAFYKPIKFGLSIGIYSWTMAWYCFYLSNLLNLKLFNAVVLVMLGFEIIYISLQALRGQGSHFNISTPTYSLLYNFMAIAAASISIYTGYICYLFFKNQFLDLSASYLWGIRLGMLLFVVFSLQGFMMGARLAHTVGAPDGGPGLWFLNWSRKYGDLRISHFLGMHALQVIPFLGFYLVKSVSGILTVGIIYFVITLTALAMAILGRAFI